MKIAGAAVLMSAALLLEIFPTGGPAVGLPEHMASAKDRRADAATGLVRARLGVRETDDDRAEHVRASDQSNQVVMWLALLAAIAAMIGVGGRHGTRTRSSVCVTRPSH